MVPISGPVEFPEWFAAGSGYATVLEHLRKRGFGESEVERIIGGNWLRLFDGFVADPGTDGRREDGVDTERSGGHEPV